MNRVFLLIPAINEKDAGQDIAYLKLLGDIEVDDVVAILIKIIKSLEYVEEEDIELVYDKDHLGQLFRHAKKMKRVDEDRGEMPHIEQLLSFFNDAVSIQDLKIGNNPVYVNGLLVENGLVNAYIENDSLYQVLLNKEALNNQNHPIETETLQGKHQNVIPLVCDAVAVYLWLVENRYPERVLDKNYKKHTGNEKHGKNGVIISAVTYTEEQLNFFLKRAVTAIRGSRELYFKDKENDKIIIFFDENLETPSYHAFEILADDMQEITKIYKRGGRSLMERIMATAEIK